MKLVEKKINVRLAQYFIIFAQILKSGFLARKCQDFATYCEFVMGRLLLSLGTPNDVRSVA